MNSWKVIEPESYYRSFIKKNQRPDGRNFDTARLCSIRVGSVETAEGSSTVKLGNTTVVCGIKAELSCPTLSSPEAGFIIPNVELFPCSSPLFKAGPPAEKAISTSHFLHSLLREGRIIDNTELCIKKDKYVWCLYVDVVCLDYDGNLVDACVTAMIAALQHLQLPLATYDEDTEAVVLDRSKPCTLTIKERPFATTFGVFDCDVLLLDPSGVDEERCCGEVVVVQMEDGTLCTTRKMGGQPISQDTMNRLIDLATARLPLLKQTLDQALQNSALSRIKLKD